MKVDTRWWRKNEEGVQRGTGGPLTQGKLQISVTYLYLPAFSWPKISSLQLQGHTCHSWLRSTSRSWLLYPLECLLSGEAWWVQNPYRARVFCSPSRISDGEIKFYLTLIPHSIHTTVRLSTVTVLKGVFRVIANSLKQ